MSENTGFGFNELFHLPMEYLQGLEKQREKIIEERRQASEDDNKNNGVTGAYAIPQNAQAIMSQARQMAAKSGMQV